MVKAIGDGAHHMLPKLGCTDDIEFPGHGDHRPLTVSVGVRNDVHSLHGIGPHRCDSVIDGP